MSSPRKITFEIKLGEKNGRKIIIVINSNNIRHQTTGEAENLLILYGKRTRKRIQKAE